MANVSLPTKERADRQKKCAGQLIRKIPTPIKIKSALPPPKKKAHNAPPETRKFMDGEDFLRKERIFPGARKIGAATSCPRIADTKFHGHEDPSELSSVKVTERIPENYRNILSFVKNSTEIPDSRVPRVIPRHPSVHDALSVSPFRKCM